MDLHRNHSKQVYQDKLKLYFNTYKSVVYSKYSVTKGLLTILSVTPILAGCNSKEVSCGKTDPVSMQQVAFANAKLWLPGQDSEAAFRKVVQKQLASGCCTFIKTHQPDRSIFDFLQDSPQPFRFVGGWKSLEHNADPGLPNTLMHSTDAEVDACGRFVKTYRETYYVENE